jgi:excisionase family DNA binding protein
MSARVKVFTEPEAAKQMRISPGTLARWRRTHYIRHWRVFGRLVKYTQDDIDANLAEMWSVRPTIVSRPVADARFG